MKRTRQWHLWIGLISSLFLLLQAVTGLIMSEPWLIGGQSEPEMRGQMMPNSSQAQTNSNSKTENGTSRNNQSMQNQFQGNGGPGGSMQGNREQNSFLTFVKGLHQGNIGGVNLHIYVDLLAIALIFLTSTGIFLSIKVLRSQAKRKRKQSVEEVT